MPALINNYTTFDEKLRKQLIHAAFKQVVVAEQPLASTVFSDNDFDYPAINEKAILLLQEFELLEENWDGEGAKKPSKNALIKAGFIVKTLQNIGQKVFHVSPGPNGEILVDIRNQSKSIELLFYNDKCKYVLFSGSENPDQGVFESSLLSKLSKWLNE